MCIGNPVGNSYWKTGRANLLLVEPAALVHDTDDWKLSGEEGYPNAIRMLETAGFPSSDVNNISGNCGAGVV